MRSNALRKLPLFARTLGGATPPPLVVPPAAPDHQRRTMAGHNKWSKIKRKKGANDAARAREHSKVARAIMAASRSCGGDVSDLRLLSAIKAARAAQLPKDRINGAVERGAKPGSGDAEMVQMRYDGSVPTPSGKVVVIAVALTDNRNRTAASVRASFNKVGGELLETGANDWMFENVGVALVPKRKSVEEGNENDQEDEFHEDDLLEAALEGNASDVDFGTEDDEHAFVKCDALDLLGLVAVLKEGMYEPSEFETRWMVKDETSMLELDESSLEKFEKFLDRMDDDVDVT
eukprot:CAMPEP_0183291002 /NCGR_PEP_ID=MMETSP0160_2-20130417/567_1 /TAXON_ID=2839 ORGANISM="Odontella Sinensis, Strain Grunow 1884" /NCGR_SAMPLE_ID=MMETSP0160_2 /ASSEMBLY_ACC=CAM_ASM_000250 /LENGTH=290 /DNA_ID=CAMNT_0025451743 /DNA_START=46 /DNA_END=915 /DNA_ORIENTATION=-